MTLADGFTDVPPGKIAAVVTYLEMHARPELRVAPDLPDVSLRPVPAPEVDWYRDLFTRIGAQDWLWSSRLMLDAAKLADIITDPQVEMYTLAVDGRDEGLLELDFREAGQCELAFFGLTRILIGRGAGRLLMNHALDRAFARPIDRFWLHTCTLDHPGAVEFYIRSGFAPYKREIEIADDPRLTGLIPEDAGPHIPIIRSQNK